ncbi:hypothetical protein MHU86_8910 [Fragilaria crotonensis]|nr:hypothetical protein MHU86_8910 [Fragilaria crotonensis]
MPSSSGCHQASRDDMTSRGTFLVVLFLGVEACAGFAPVRTWQTNRHVSMTKIYSSASTNVEANDKDASLVFRLDSVFSSDPVPAATPQEILAFFQEPVQRNCMVSAGNTRKVEELEHSDELLKLWKRRSPELGATDPDESDSILKVEAGGMHFPGLTLTSEAYIGAKLLEPSGDGYPVYEFSLIVDKQRVEGFKIAVWIFNKLTGADDDTSKNKAVSRSRTEVTATTMEDGQTIFQFHLSFTIQVFFPKLLLRILPVSKEKAEEQGSAAIGKALEKDLNNAMKVLRQQFLERRA